MLLNELQKQQRHAAEQAARIRSLESPTESRITQRSLIAPSCVYSRMGNARGVKRDFVALEKRRFQAVKLFNKDLNNSEIGRRLKVSNQTVSRWRKEHQQGGNVALRQAGRAGRLPCLNETDKGRLVELLLQGPEHLGYDTPLWTCQRVAHLIEKNFEVDYHPGHVWRILRQLNWSVQQPVGRALERNEALIADWKHKRWPEIKKKLRKKA